MANTVPCLNLPFACIPPMPTLPPMPGDSVPLEELDRITWDELTHAYGPASDVPALLRAVLQGGEDADEAWNDLHGNIWHQGTVYEATAPAIPFLLGGFLDRCKAVENRRQFGRFLRLCAEGTSFTEVHRPLLGRITEDDDAQVVIERRWITAIHQALDASTEQVRASLLDQAEADGIRADALALLLANPLSRANAVALISTQIWDGGASVRAVCALAAARLEPAESHLAALLDEAFDREEDPLVAVCLATRAVRSTHPDRARKGFDTCARILMDPPNGLEKRYADLGQEPAELETLVIEACSAGSLPQRRDLIEGINVRLLASSGWSDGVEWLAASLALAFRPHSSPGQKVRAKDLDPAQRRALTGILAADGIWQPPGRLGMLLSYGLPETRPMLKAFLAQRAGSDPPRRAGRTQGTPGRGWWDRFWRR